MRKTKRLKKRKAGKRFRKLHAFRKVGRKFRGLVRKCENCGKRRQELFKVYSFTKSGQKKKHYFCKTCYSKMITKKEREEFS